MDLYSFSTSAVTEKSLREVDEEIRRYIRNENPRSRKIKKVPEWLHRDVRHKHLGNGSFVVEVSGLCNLPLRPFGERFDVSFRVRTIKRRGVVFHISTVGVMVPRDSGLIRKPSSIRNLQRKSHIL